MTPITECERKNHVMTMLADGYLCECGQFFPLGYFAKGEVEINVSDCASGRCGI